MNIQLKAKRQDGFTIIELVVVILLLGILAATALPRFLDVTDEAHEAAVEGVLGGLSTGAALFRANWVASGQAADALNSGFGDDTLFANEHGYPVGHTDAVLDEDSCAQIFTGLLQGGSPAVIAGASGFDSDNNTGDPESLIEAVATTDYQWVALTTFDSNVQSDNANDDTVDDATNCRYYYIGQGNVAGTVASPVDLPTIALNIVNGNVTTSTTTLDAN